MQFRASTSAAWQRRGFAGGRPWLALLAFLITLQPVTAGSAAAQSVRLTEPVVAGLPLARQAEGNARLAGALASLKERAIATGFIEVAVKTAVAFAPESMLTPIDRLEQRRDIAAAAQALRQALPEAKSFSAMEDMPYVILTLDPQGLARLETIPGLVRITPADHLNWRRDHVETRQAALAAAQSTSSTGNGTREPPRAAIVGGKTADPGTHPFHVGLMTKSIKDNFVARFCGGALVSPTHVVTAAHCVDDDDETASSIEVLVGARRLDGSGRRVGVARTFLHPRWRLGSHRGIDAAVLELAEPVSGIPFATIASRQPAVPGEILRITGWGDRSPIDWQDEDIGGEGDFPVDLMQADLPYRPYDPNAYGSCGMDPHIICAGGNGISNTCGGDSGGPVTINRGAGYSELVGIMSTNSGCELTSDPAKLTNIAYSEVHSFIRRIMAMPPKIIGHAAVSRTVSEGAKSVTLVLQRPSTEGVAQVNFATANGTAIFRTDSFFRSDYWGQSGTVTFWPGQARAEIKITLVDDKEKERSEFFTVTLSRASASWPVSGNGIAIVTISDND